MLTMCSVVCFLSCFFCFCCCCFVALGSQLVRIKPHFPAAAAASAAAAVQCSVYRFFSCRNSSLLSISLCVCLCRFYFVFVFIFLERQQQKQQQRSN